MRERENNFGDKLREIKADMSVTAFAEKLGLSRQTVGFYLNGDRIPDILTLKQICEKCNVSADDILDISNPERKWIMANETRPPKDIEGIVCSGIDGGWWRPQKIEVDEYGEVTAILSGKSRKVYAWTKIPNPPIKEKPKRNCKKDCDPRKGRQRNILQWPFGLLAAIDKEYFKANILLAETPAGFYDALDMALAKLTERERNMLLEYYRDALTLRLIAKNWGLTTERVRQILHKATRKMNRAECKEMLRSGEMRIIEMAYPTPDSNELDCSDDTLSVRSFNALKRSGVNSKTDLLRLTDEQLLAIRNIGKSSLRNVKEYKEKILTEIENSTRRAK